MNPGRLLYVSVIAALTAMPCSSALADAEWTGLGGDDLWTTAANWDPGIPVSATVRDIVPGDQNNVARSKLDGTNITIQDGIDAIAFAVQIGGLKEGVFGNQSASNTLTMTGGTLTTQGNFLMNIGRGTNVLPGHLVQFNMSGGLVNAAGITVPEAFSPPVGSVGLNAEMHVSGNSVVNTDLLRLGASDANSTITVSDNAQINLTDNNSGFANGQLWFEAFEDFDATGGTSVLDISDLGVVRIHGGVNNISDDQAASYGLILNELIPRGMIIANGGADPVLSTLTGDGVIVLGADPSVIPALDGDINGDGFVGIGDLSLVLADWNQSSTPAGVILSDFSNFNLTGTYAQWDNGTITSGADDFTVQANDFGGGFLTFASAIDATGELTLEVQLDVNAGNVADKFNIVLVDADGTERVYRFDGLTIGDDQTLTIDLVNFLQDNVVGGVPGLDLSNLTAFHTQGTFSNGNPGLAMDLTFDDLRLTGGGGGLIPLDGDANGDGFVGIDDLNIVLANWNNGIPPIANAVPEPGTLAVLGPLALLPFRRRR